MTWALDLDLPEGLKLLLIALASFADDDGANVYPSVETLARMTSTEPRTVWRRLARLRALGVLEVETAGGGRRRSTHYRIRPETLTPASGFEPSETLAPPSGFGPETLTLTTRNPDAGVRGIVRDSSTRESSSGDARPDIAALRARGWKISHGQALILDEIADRHEGRAYAAGIIAATTERDPLTAVMDADRAWQAEQRDRVNAEEASWQATKAREVEEIRVLRDRVAS